MKKQPNKHYTMSDIAKKANVSLSTVSRVLNESAPVKEETRKAVMEVIEQYDYIPNAFARGLVTNSSKSIGFMIPDILNPFYPQLIQSVDNVTSANGFFLELYITRMQSKKVHYYLNEMISRRTGGVIVMCSKIEDLEYICKVKQHLHIVSIQSDIENVDFIDTNSEEGTYKIIEHLIELGHQQIAFIGYYLDISALSKRVSGYKRAMNDHGLEINEDYIIEGEGFGDTGYVMTKKLLSLPNPPTAIHCFNEYMATGAYRAINEANLKIPDDISVTGFDNLSFSKIMNPPLTTVSQPVNSMGTLAGELLVKNIMNGHIGTHQSITLPTEVVIRSSTAPPKKRTTP